MIGYGLPLKLGVTRISTFAVRVLLIMVIIQNRFSFKKNIKLFGNFLKELRSCQPSSGILSIK